MFYYLYGNLEIDEPGVCIVDCGGVGYKLTTSLITSELLSDKVGQKVKIFTHLAVREDGIELFGFATEDELASFKLLISVSGVGPKAAMSILSLLSPEKFALAVCTDDKKTIAKANGIGPKTAARIILELKDKLSAEYSTAEVAEFSAKGSTTAAPSANLRGKLAEATDALIVLGYSRNEAAQSLKELDVEHMELEEIIRTALKKMKF